MIGACNQSHVSVIPGGHQKLERRTWMGNYYYYCMQEKRKEPECNQKQSFGMSGGVGSEGVED